MAGEVRIITHNANGISGDAVTLQELLQRKGVDIAFVCETSCLSISPGEILDIGPTIFKDRTHLTGERL
jgi:hypothetical protein